MIVDLMVARVFVRKGECIVHLFEGVLAEFILCLEVMDFYITVTIGRRI